jgi:hypothetical protein
MTQEIEHCTGGFYSLEICEHAYRTVNGGKPMRLNDMTEERRQEIVAHLPSCSICAKWHKNATNSYERERKAAERRAQP